MALSYIPNKPTFMFTRYPKFTYSLAYTPQGIRIAYRIGKFAMMSLFILVNQSILWPYDALKIILHTRVNNFSPYVKVTRMNK